jgi:hypothetical protein
MPEPVVSPVEEFSYFTNYDQYLNVDSRADIKGATEALENMAIDLSPIESGQYALTPPPTTQCAETEVVAPVLSRSYSSGTPGYTLSTSSPVTPYQLADIAVRIPNWLIGAIG